MLSGCNSQPKAFDMKKFLTRSLLVLGALFATACNVGGGSSVDPPTDVKVLVGDGGVTVSWTMNSGVEYWVFSAAADSISTDNWSTLPQAKVVRNAASPQIVTGLINGTTYSFTVNGRSSGGPGGPGSTSISVVPRLAGLAWTAGTPLASSNLKGLGFIALTFPGQFVTVGAGGTAFTSPDAINWATVTTGVTTDLNAVAFGGGNFVAVGAGGVIVNSADASTWTTQTSGTTNDLYGVALGSAGLVAVGANGTVLRSTDGGNNWSVQTSGTANHLYGVTFANLQYVAVGAQGTVLTSADGGIWTVATAGTGQDLRGVAYSAIGLLHVAVGAAGTMLSSPDAITWTAIAPVTANTLNGVAFGNQFTAVGDNGTILASTDGLNWQIVPSGTTSNLNAVLFGLVGYATVGVGGVNLTSY
jgi:hypothetical protein